MATRDAPNAYESLKIARLFMVLSSLSPLFILWAIRGNNVVRDSWFIGVCASMVLVPTAFLWWRIRKAKRGNDMRELVAGVSEDHRSHVLLYLFTILLPFYRSDLETCRDFWAMCMALAFIVFLFWRLNLHYINLVFAVLNYRVFTISPPRDGNPFSGTEPFVLITRRRTVFPGDSFRAYRLSDTVYLEQTDAS